MRILDINRRNSGELSSVTLEVTNEQAVKLINSMRNGAIQLGLINPNGYVYEEGTSDILVNPAVKPVNAVVKEEETTQTETQTKEESDVIQPAAESDVIAPETDE